MKRRFDLAIWLVERIIQSMKCLTVTYDGRELFSGEVAELTWNENVESVSVTARFAPSPSLLQSLQQIASARAQRPPEPDGSPGRPTLDVVRGDSE